MQTLIVGLIVAAAVAYLIRTTWLSLAGKKGCGSCGGDKCGPAKSAGPQLVQLDASMLAKKPPGGKNGVATPRP